MKSTEALFQYRKHSDKHVERKILLLNSIQVPLQPSFFLSFDSPNPSIHILAGLHFVFFLLRNNRLQSGHLMFPSTLFLGSKYQFWISQLRYQIILVWFSVIFNRQVTLIPTLAFDKSV